MAMKEYKLKIWELSDVSEVCPKCKGDKVLNLGLANDGGYMLCLCTKCGGDGLINYSVWRGDTAGKGGKQYNGGHEVLPTWG